MFIEKRYPNPLQSRRDVMFMLLPNVTHIVPTKSTPNARLAFAGTEVTIKLNLSSKIDVYGVRFSIHLSHLWCLCLGSMCFLYTFRTSGA